MIEEFKNAMRDNGIEPPVNIVPDGILHRFKIDGKNKGWFVLHGGDYWAGAFGDWSKDLKVKWKQGSNVKNIFTDEMKKKMELDKLLRKQKFENDRKEAAQLANILWRKCIITYGHAYTDSKNIDPIGARIHIDRLVIPIHNKEGELVNMQFINNHGKKRFLTGGEKKGCFFELEGDYETILICEGYATGVSLYSKYYCTVIVAFDAGNIEPVAVNVRQLYPNSEIIIAADNDESGVGERKAREACLAIGCSYIMPDVVGMDFNDYLSGEL